MTTDSSQPDPVLEEHLKVRGLPLDGTWNDVVNSRRKNLVDDSPAIDDATGDDVRRHHAEVRGLDPDKASWNDILACTGRKLG